MRTHLFITCICRYAYRKIISLMEYAHKNIYLHTYLRTYIHTDMYVRTYVTAPRALNS